MKSKVIILATPLRRTIIAVATQTQKCFKSSRYEKHSNENDPNIS